MCVQADGNVVASFDRRGQFIITGNSRGKVSKQIYILCIYVCVCVCMYMYVRAYDNGQSSDIFRPTLAFDRPNQI